MRSPSAAARLEENRRVPISGGPYGILVPEHEYPLVTRAYVRERLIDFFEAPSLPTTYNRMIRAKSPLDLTACWQEVETIKQILVEEGRPGMGIGSPNTTASAVGVLSSVSYGGVRPTDWNHNNFLSELKIGYENLLRMSHFYHTGCYNHSFYNPIFGGYAGGGPGIAVIGVAGLMLMKASLLVDTVNLGPIARPPELQHLPRDHHRQIDLPAGAGAQHPPHDLLLLTAG